MVKLEEVLPGAVLKGLTPSDLATVVSARWHGTAVIEVVYRDAAGAVGQELLFRDREAQLELAETGARWGFDADGNLLRLVSEAYRIRLAWLFDPFLAVQTSLITPLPHQITAVYGEMLPQQHLRFLLADDPGAGKTIMAGLLIKELLVRGDLQRCAIVCPGNLAEQWQDELHTKFGLPFEILTNDKLEASRTGNWFTENDLVICRLDKLSRNDDVREQMLVPDWDLVIVDEAHKMSATYFGSEVKYTKRYRLGEALAGRARHFLLMTATPHNGKEADFQLFMALLDGDRFEGKFRDGVHAIDTSNLMRRMVKEGLVKFDGTPLFPERRAYTVNYRLSDAEADLYNQVTRYVTEEFNRAEALQNDGRAGTVGFALTILQRRLASSPEAIYQSLRRRRERLEARLAEEELARRGQAIAALTAAGPAMTDEEVEEAEDDAPGEELEELEEAVVDQATAARTIQELRAEIAELRRLEELAGRVRASGTDRKWDELSRTLQESEEMFDAHGHRRKLVVFTEHRDTLSYLASKIRTLLGRHDAVATIHGGLGRDERRKQESLFKQDKDVEVLVATDAAGEGINLQRAHLMVNYDLPWNPNRIEQRFGRIHRIGQTEVCHLWNLVASETREGHVFVTLCHKLEEESRALGGQVFDVLGRAFGEVSLRQLLLEAIRDGDRPEVRARLTRIVEEKLDRDHLRHLVEEHALAETSLDASTLRKVRDDMERAEARRLQPRYIASFFFEAFKGLGGTWQEREPSRFELTHVPAAVRNRDRLIGRREPVLPRYERITFERDLVAPYGKPVADLVCPGHPLLDAVIDLVLERHRDLLRRGAVLVDPADDSDDVRALVYVEHTLQDGRPAVDGRRVISREMQFVEISYDGTARPGGGAPYLDYRPATEEERTALGPVLGKLGLTDGFEERAFSFAISEIVPGHLDRVKTAREERVAKTLAAVKDRLTKEINYWDHRAEELRAQEAAGRQPRMQWQNARRRADDLQARLQKRIEELNQERHVTAAPPVVIGGALVVPAGFVARLMGKAAPHDLGAVDTKEVERLAMEAVFAAERALGHEPVDVSARKCGWDVESRPAGGPLRLIEVKGRAKGATTVTVTKNEIFHALNRPDTFILAIVQVDGVATDVRYVRRPFQQEPDFAATSVNYDLARLLKNAEVPS